MLDEVEPVDGVTRTFENSISVTGMAFILHRLESGQEFETPDGEIYWMDLSTHTVCKRKVGEPRPSVPPLV